MKARQIIAGLLIATAVAAAVYFVNLRRSVTAAPGRVIVVNSTLKAHGPANAPVQLVEYADYQCPACKNVQPILKELFAKYPDQIHFTFYHFPLDGHVWSRKAHHAAECANRQGKFWAYHERLYAEQEKWSGPTEPTEKFFAYAKDAGVDLDRFAACLEDTSVPTDVLKEKKSGEARQVTSTPTLFINDTRLVGPVQMKAEAAAVIDKILNPAPAEAS